MNRNTQQILLASGLSGMVTTLVALLCAPSFWWLGTLAGMAVGYLGYEFRDIVKAVPVAFRNATRGLGWIAKSVRDGCQLYGKVGLIAKLSALSFVAFFAVLLVHWMCVYVPEESTSTSFVLIGYGWHYALKPVLIAVAAMVVSGCFSVLLAYIADFGGFVQQEACALVGAPWSDQKANELHYNTHTDNLPSGKMSGLLLTGLVSIVPAMIASVFLLAGLLLRVLYALVAYVVRTVHCNERIICAFYGAGGGTASYFLFATSLASPLSVAAVACGGAIGAALGLLGSRLADSLRDYGPSNAAG